MTDVKEPAGRYRVTAIGQTDVGLRRDNNEDSLLIADLTTGVTVRPFSTFRRQIGKSGCLFIVDELALLHPELPSEPWDALLERYFGHARTLAAA